MKTLSNIIKLCKLYEISNFIEINIRNFRLFFFYFIFFSYPCRLLEYNLVTEV